LVPWERDSMENPNKGELKVSRDEIVHIFSLDKIQWKIPIKGN
jgi:hypothetical protein